MPANLKELVSPYSTLVQEDSVFTKEDVASVVESMGLVPPQALLNEEGTRFNDMSLSGQSSLAFTLDKEFGKVHGVNYSVTLSEPVVVQDDAMLSNIRFFSGGNVGGPFIRVRALAEKTKTKTNIKVVFNNCMFVRGKGHGTLPFIEIDDGAKVVFLGCYFIGDSGAPETRREAGMIQINTTNITHTQLIGCVRSPTNGYFEAGTAAVPVNPATKIGCI